MSKRILFCLLFIWPFSLYSQNIDIRLLRSINSPETKPSDNFFRFVSNSEIYVVLTIPAGMAAAGWIKDDKELVYNCPFLYMGRHCGFFPNGYWSSLPLRCFSRSFDRIRISFSDI